MVEEYHHHAVGGSLSFCNHGVLLPALLSITGHSHSPPPPPYSSLALTHSSFTFFSLFSSIACPLSLTSLLFVEAQHPFQNSHGTVLRSLMRSCSKLACCSTGTLRIPESPPPPRFGGAGALMTELQKAKCSDHGPVADLQS